MNQSHLTLYWRSLAGAVLACALLFLALMATFSPRAAAYALIGPRWNGQPTAGCCANLYVEYGALYSGDATIWDEEGRGGMGRLPTSSTSKPPRRSSS